MKNIKCGVEEQKLLKKLAVYGTISIASLFLWEIAFSPSPFEALFILFFYLINLLLINTFFEFKEFKEYEIVKTTPSKMAVMKSKLKKRLVTFDTSWGRVSFEGKTRKKQKVRKER